MKLEKQTLYPTHCGLCGGLLGKVTRYDKIYCTQKNGHCGRLLLGPTGDDKQTGYVPHAFFNRTEWDAVSGAVIVTRYPWPARVDMWFIAGEEVTGQEYLERAALACQGEPAIIFD
jgi:hypothetical protein